MKVQCSISASQLGSLTESPLHVLQGNQDSAPVFFGIFIHASCARPAFNGRQCNLPTGDPVADAMAQDTWYLTHNWHDINDDMTAVLDQTDNVDPDTFQVSASVNTDTWPGGFWAGGIAIPNSPISFNFLPPDTGANIGGSASNPFDQASARAALMAALFALDLSLIWSGAGIPVSGPEIGGGTLIGGYAYDRLGSIFGGLGLQDGVLKADTTGPGGSTPAVVSILAVSSAGGSTSVNSAVDIIGIQGQISFTRAQVQIRNFSGSIPYAFFDLYGGTRTDGGSDFYKDRPGEGGAFVTDHQIVEIPLPLIQSMPTQISTALGDQAVTAAQTFMLIGVTFAEFCAGNFIPPENIL